MKNRLMRFWDDHQWEIACACMGMSAGVMLISALEHTNTMELRISIKQAKTLLANPSESVADFKTGRGPIRVVIDPTL